MAAKALPRTFGRYTLLTSLGRGGMGEVYAAVISSGGTGTDKRCVIKTLHAELAKEAEYVTRFLDEARLAVHLNQENICSVFDVGRIDGQHYLAMDLIDGRDLRSVWRRCLELGRRLDPALSVHIMAQVLDGLDYAHTLADENGQPLRIVHRDISPQNVMISFDGEVKVIDFGFAASRLKLGKTDENMVVGKLAYMAPEQLMGEEIDGRTDIFAAGVVLYELVAGERYYEGTRAVLLPTTLTSGSYLPRSWSTLPDGLGPLLQRALAFERADRFPQAASFAEALRTWARWKELPGTAAMLRQEMKVLFGDKEPSQKEPLPSSGQATAAQTPTPSPQKPQEAAQAANDNLSENSKTFPLARHDVGIDAMTIATPPETAARTREFAGDPEQRPGSAASRPLLLLVAIGSMVALLVGVILLFVYLKRG